MLKNLEYLSNLLRLMGQRTRIEGIVLFIFGEIPGLCTGALLAIFLGTTGRDSGILPEKLLEHHKHIQMLIMQV